MTEPVNVLLLDEPTNDLALSRCNVLDDAFGRARHRADHQSRSAPVAQHMHQGGQGAGLSGRAPHHWGRGVPAPSARPGIVSAAQVVPRPSVNEAGSAPARPAKAQRRPMAAAERRAQRAELNPMFRTSGCQKGLRWPNENRAFRGSIGGAVAPLGESLKSGLWLPTVRHGSPLVAWGWVGTGVGWGGVGVPDGVAGRGFWSGWCGAGGRSGHGAGVS